MGARTGARAALDERYSLQEGLDEQREVRLCGAIDFAIDGDLRFLSHQETLRMFARACARAHLPVRFSEGFNPHPRISLPLPRPVGVASDAERVVIEWDRAIAPTTVVDMLAPQMPEGVSMHRARMLAPGERCVPTTVGYRVTVAGQDPMELTRHAESLMQAGSIPYRRFVHKTGTTVGINLRPYIENIRVGEDFVALRLHVTGGGSAKPAEICDVLGIGQQHMNHLIRRTEVAWRHVH